MQLRFKQQKFQADAAAAIRDVFRGQSKQTTSYMIDKGSAMSNEKITLLEGDEWTGYRNAPLIPELTDEVILENLNKVQRSAGLPVSKSLEGKFNLTVDMETGVGKTYTYIKTMYELNKQYGWSKFIVVVPSVAIREGVYKSFQITQEHFAEEYHKKIRFFIYNSKNLSQIDKFASDANINVMIINSQAFNARGKDARRIFLEMDSFRSRRPIDIIAKTNPILIIDEPQSVEGKETKERLKDFKPLMMLRYSATHKKEAMYNLVYRLDAMEAYNKKLVKKISVKGISVVGSTATEGYLYLESVNLSKTKNPTATLEFETKGATSVRKVSRNVTVGYNLHEHSDLEQYKGYVVASIDGRDNSLVFTNGVKIFSGEVKGAVNEDHVRRIQIRETIKSHFARERQLFHKGIKVLSLFFIDEVAKYKQYDEQNKAFNGEYAKIFEEEYELALAEWQFALAEDEYMKYLSKIKATTTHAGYFSIDKNKKTGTVKFVDSKLSDKKTAVSDDADAYDLIMRDKERLLDRKEPVRFIFSHSALREGWDNPNVFQICTLKQSGSDTRKRQEVGRGLRLSVNASGERMDINVLGDDVHNVNVLTVIANESYDSFSSKLQSELAEVITARPQEVSSKLFENKIICDVNGLEQVVDHTLAIEIMESLIAEKYIKKGMLTDKYYEDLKSGKLNLAEELQPYRADIVSILDTIYNPEQIKPEDARAGNVELQINQTNFSKKEFKALWGKINSKSAYTVSFDTDDLIRKAIAALDSNLRVSQVYLKVESGDMQQIHSQESLLTTKNFKKDTSKTTMVEVHANTKVKYDLIGKIALDTGLTRNTLVKILTGISKNTFSYFKLNPEEFIIRATDIINEQKATVIIEHITYNKLDEVYDMRIFTEPTLKGRQYKLGVNALETPQKNVYAHAIYDSNIEKDFASELDSKEEISVYVKLPRGFFIDTPVGKYNPDWAIAFNDGVVRHIYFVAETKGDNSTLQLRDVETLKKHCATEHLKAISSATVKYGVVSCYDDLLKEVMR